MSDELPDLTPKQEAFVHGILSGLTASDAYRKAYDCSNMTDRSIWRRASDVRSNSKVAAWLDQARALSLADGKFTLDGHLNTLARLRDEAQAAGNYGAAVQAEQLRGKANRVYVEQVQDMGTSTEALRKQLELIQDQFPEMAAQLAVMLGIDKTTQDRDEIH